jgi:hypothetical protein
LVVAKTTRDDEMAILTRLLGRAPDRVVGERMRSTEWRCDGWRGVQDEGTDTLSRALSHMRRYRFHCPALTRFQAIEETMVAKSKAKSKHRPTVKPKRRESKPLLARSAEVRKAKPASRRRVAVAARVPLAGSPFAIFGMMGRVVQDYAELPGRLAQCRSPMDVWLEQVRFTLRVFS